MLKIQFFVEIFIAADDLLLRRYSSLFYTDTLMTKPLFAGETEISKVSSRTWRNRPVDLKNDQPF